MPYGLYLIMMEPNLCSWTSKCYVYEYDFQLLMIFHSSYNNTFSLVNSLTLNHLLFNSDGTKMFICDSMKVRVKNILFQPLLISTSASCSNYLEY